MKVFRFSFAIQNGFMPILTKLYSQNLRLLCERVFGLMNSNEEPSKTKPEL